MSVASANLSITGPALIRSQVLAETNSGGKLLER
jgi:hypothetical protein